MFRSERPPAKSTSRVCASGLVKRSTVPSLALGSSSIAQSRVAELGVRLTPESDHELIDQRAEAEVVNFVPPESGARLGLRLV